MRWRLIVAVLAATAALVPTARADGAGASPGVFFGWNGVVSQGDNVRYTTLPGGGATVLAAISTRDGTVLRWRTFPGQYGIPAVANDGTAGGLSTDGRTLILADASAAAQPLRKQSSFIALNPRRLAVRSSVDLRGDFTYDALSPNGRTLYLIQHVDKQDVLRYVVRAYDLERGTLLPGRIADRSQKSWIMSGYPFTRATSADGRWVYTLYRNDGGYPFVHALDTVAMKAHCVGLPWKGASQDPLWNIRMQVKGDKLDLRWRSGRPYLAIDTQTFRISYPHAGSFPWLPAGAGIGGAVLLAAAALVLRRRLHERTRVERLPLAEREVVA